MRKIAHNEKDIQKRRATWPEQWTAYQSQGLTVEKNQGNSLLNHRPRQGATGLYREGQECPDGI